MALEVVGAGFGRTGTLSLKAALETLGFGKCYHMAEVHLNPDHRSVWLAAHRRQPVDWDALFRGYRAAVDWPSCNFWEPQAAHYPDAKVLLSLRDPDRWYDSVMNTIYAVSRRMYESEVPEMHESGVWAREIIWDGVFGGRMEDRAHVIDVYQKHNERVIKSVPRERLLVFDPKEGWEPLCRFLDRPVPDGPFPRVNTRAEFAARFPG